MRRPLAAALFVSLALCAPTALAQTAPAPTAPPAPPAPSPPIADPIETPAEAVGLTGSPDTVAPESTAPSRPLASDQGRLRVAVNRPNTDVVVDDRDVGLAPLELDLTAGTHRVRLESPGQRTWRGTVDIVPGTLTPLRAFLRASPGHNNGWTATVFAVLLAGAGTTLGVLSAQDSAALDTARANGTLDNHDPRIDRGTVYAGSADLAFGIAAVVGAIGVYFLFAEPGEPSVAHVGRRHRLHLDGAQ